MRNWKALALAAALGALTGCSDNSNVYVGDILSGGNGLGGVGGGGGSTPDLQVPPAGPTQPFAGIVEAEFRQRQRTNKVDILFTVDNSGSMSTHIQKVADNIASFVDTLVRRDVDFQLGVVMSSEDSDGVVRPHLRGPHPVIRRNDADISNRIVDNLEAVLAANVGGIELGVTILEQAIRFPVNQLLFREDAAKVFVVMTDADDDGGGADQAQRLSGVFDTFTGGLPWMMLGIRPDPANYCGTEESAAPLLDALVSLSSGVSGDICAADFSPILERAAEQIFSFLYEFSMARFEELRWVNIRSIDVTVDGTPVPRDDVRGYTWIPETLSIAFRGSYVPPEGSRINVRIAYESPN